MLNKDGKELGNSESETEGDDDKGWKYPLNK